MLAWVFISLFIMLFMSIPISISIAGVSLLPRLMDSSFPGSTEFVVRGMLGGVDSFPLLAIPLFILSGNIMAKGKISKKIFDAFAYFLGNKTAGMPIAVIFTCLFFGAISGSAPATTAAVGAMSIPVLVELGYDKRFATALCAVAGGIGVIIPPSIPFILYGMASGTSVGAMFIAGILPGIFIALCLISYSIIYCLKNGEDKQTLALQHAEITKNGFWSLFINGFWAFLSPVIILGSIYSGIASPTEAATISVFYSTAVVLWVYKTIQVKDLIPIMLETIKTYAPLLFILATATAFARILAMLDAPAVISDLIVSNVKGKIAILLILNLLLLIVGMIMDTGPAILILTPILLPIVAEIGVDPVHFGIIMVVNLAIGFVTPPIGVNLFIASAMTKIDITEIVRYALPFIVAFLIALLVLTYVPAISLILL